MWAKRHHNQSRFSFALSMLNGVMASDDEICVNKQYLADRLYLQQPATLIQQLAVSAARTLANHRDPRSPCSLWGPT